MPPIPLKLASFQSRGWRTRVAMLLTALGILHAPHLCGQAPDAIGHATFWYTTSSPGFAQPTWRLIYELRADGTYRVLYLKYTESTSNGPGHGTPVSSPVTGAYSYDKLSDSSATLTFPGGGGGPNLPIALTFTSAHSGTASHGSSNSPFSLRPVPLNEPLVNTSQRAWTTDTHPSIIGFVLTRNSTVLIRAVGPGLAAFPGTTPAIDSRLEVFTGPVNVASSDDWGRYKVAASDSTFYRDQTAPNPNLIETVTVVSEFVGAFPLAHDSKDAAVIVTLPPGSHTVHIRTAPGEPMAEVLGEVYVIN